ncbi:MAG: prepilin peptidase [Candidatus Omnitrophica bacterium]|nr:prepilin peptidase [Candidatus Omnitrophota bacterium]
MLDMLMPFDKVLVFILGAMIGSFLNVCIFRLPKEQSIVKPRSFCPKCKKPIKWYDNIPVLSYILLKAKCRNCQEKISLRYPVIEILTSVILGFLYINFSWSILFFEFSFFFCLLIVVSFIDIDYHAIPAYLCVFGIAVGLLFAFFQSGNFINIIIDFMKVFAGSRAQEINNPPTAFLNSTLGLLFGLGFTYLFKLFGDVLIGLYLSLRKKDSIEGEKESMGLGDVDFMGMVGVFMGFKAVIMVFFLAPFFAIIYSIIALIFKRSHLIPYLPYLSAATLVTFFWGDRILRLIF